MYRPTNYLSTDELWQTAPNYVVVSSTPILGDDFGVHHNKHQNNHHRHHETRGDLIPDERRRYSSNNEATAEATWEEATSETYSEEECVLYDDECIRYWMVLFLFFMFLAILCTIVWSLVQLIPEPI